MALVALAAGVCALSMTMRSLEGRPNLAYYFLGFIVSDIAYLGALALVASCCLPRTHVMVLVVAAFALSVILIEAAAGAGGSTALTAILGLPLVPLAIMGIMLRVQAAHARDEDSTAGTSETAGALVRNRRRRGLLPQTDAPLSQAVDVAAIREFRRKSRPSPKAILVFAAALVIVVAATMGIAGVFAELFWGE